ncbi:hypothetical protein TCE0_041f13639 [Talaromyces pinophilus]|uniref:Uncharacterized protein n=1 Tax=Talaromyces pinophilus TaxID=128442 RepID=A0A6V8HG99_TALPI|nr:hypothetical protein TCE0_041f13639 [Talaromyces pinophilus]
MPHKILPESATAEEVFHELKASAASGDLLRLDDALQKWDSVDDLPWFIPNMSESLLQCEHPISDKALALQQVLNVAAKQGHTEIVAFLLDQKGCIVTRMAIKPALVRKQWDVMQLFLDRGWNINSPVEGGNTCSVLNHAGKIAPVKTLKILKEYGADFTKSNALHEAALGLKPGRVEVMAYLLDEAGVPINQREFEYDASFFNELRQLGLGTALHKAVEDKCLETVKFLLNRGIDRDIEDTKGRKAVDLARTYEFEEALALLQ